MSFLIFLSTFAIIAALLQLQYIIAKEFYSIAIAKGYNSKKYLWYCFFLGIVGYLMVIAIPDENILKQLSNKNIVTKQANDELPEL